MSMPGKSSEAFHRGTAPIFALLTPEQTRRLAELEGDESLVERVAELVDKANEDELTAAERAEYEAYIEADNLLAILRSEAQFRVGQVWP